MNIVSRLTKTQNGVWLSGILIGCAVAVAQAVSPRLSGAEVERIAPRSADAEHVAWRFQIDAPYVLHRPAIAPDGTVYVQDVRGFLYALTHEGVLLWTYNAGSYPSGGGGEGPVSLLADGTVIVVGNPLGPDVQIHAVHPDGTRRWVFTNTNTQGVIAGPAVGPDGNIYFATDLGGRGLVCLSPAGQELWSNAGSPTLEEYGQLGEEIVFGPSVPGGPVDQLYCAFDEYAVADQAYLYAFTLTGSQRFLAASGGQSDPLGQRQGQPAVGPSGAVYLCGLIGTMGWRLQSFHPGNGSRTWTYFPNGTNLLTEPDVGPDGTIFVGRNLSELHAVSPDATQRWVHVDPGILFAPIASPADDIVLMGGRITYGAPGFIKAVGIADGNLLWTIDLPSEGGASMIPYSRPKFSGDGSRAYISTALPGGPDYCYLYAIDVQPSSSAVGGESAPTLPLWATAAPNPFGESTTIRYRREVNQQLRARIFDADGRLIRSLRLAADTGAGSVTWDGCDEAGRTVGGGLYFARLQSRDRSIVLKMVRTP